MAQLRRKPFVIPPGPSGAKPPNFHTHIPVSPPSLLSTHSGKAVQLPEDFKIKGRGKGAFEASGATKYFPPDDDDRYGRKCAEFTEDRLHQSVQGIAAATMTSHAGHDTSAVAAIPIHGAAAAAHALPTFTPAHTPVFAPIGAPASAAPAPHFAHMAFLVSGAQDMAAHGGVPKMAIGLPSLEHMSMLRSAPPLPPPLPPVQPAAPPSWQWGLSGLSKSEIGVSVGSAAGLATLMGLIEGTILELLTARDANGVEIGRHKWYRWVQIGLWIAKGALLVLGIAALVTSGGTVSIALLGINFVVAILFNYLGAKVGGWLARKLKILWPSLAIKTPAGEVPPPPAVWQAHGHSQSEGYLCLGMCLICDERPVSTAFVPCGHATYCSACVQNPANFGPHRALACPQCNESAPVAEVLLIAPPAADIPRCRVNTCVWVDRCSHINHHGKHACGKTSKIISWIEPRKVGLRACEEHRHAEGARCPHNPTTYLVRGAGNDVADLHAPAVGV